MRSPCEISSGVRIEWSFELRSACQQLAGAALDGDPTCIAEVVEALQRDVPEPDGPTEVLLLRESLDLHLVILCGRSIGASMPGSPAARARIRFWQCGSMARPGGRTDARLTRTMAGGVHDPIRTAPPVAARCSGEAHHPAGVRESVDAAGVERASGCEPNGSERAVPRHVRRNAGKSPGAIENSACAVAVERLRPELGRHRADGRLPERGEAASTRPFVHRPHPGGHPPTWYAAVQRPARCQAWRSWPT